MPIIASLARDAFDPEALRVLEAAFNAAWKTLNSSGSDLAAESRAASTRELLARRIIEMAERGESDPRRLVDDALLHLATARQDNAPPKLSADPTKVRGAENKRQKKPMTCPP